MESNHSRRQFLKTMSLSAAAIMVGRAVPALGVRHQTGNSPAGNAPAAPKPLPRRILGKTGVPVSVLALGGEARIERRHYLPFGGADAIINRALDLGINYIDTSAWYGQGTSERNIGRVLQSRRGEVFLATKSHERSYDGTMRLAEQSLNNLRTDTIDLYQVHDVRTHEQLDLILSQRGALRAMERLRDEGVVRYIGITGHWDPEVLLRGIRDYPFDAILLSLNAADIHYNPFQTKLLETAIDQNLGILAMKVFAKGRLLAPNGKIELRQALGYVLSFPVSSAVVGISSIAELEQDVQIATTEESPYSTEEMTRIEELAFSGARDGNWFKKQT